MHFESATVARVHPSGVSSHVWSVTSRDANSSDDLMKEAVYGGSIVDPGLYVVCWNVINKIPFARLYTVYRDDEGVVRYRGGYPTQDRVNRWPPKPSPGT